METFIGMLPTLGYVALVVYWIGVIVALIRSDREPTSTLAWILVLALLPGFGLILYFFLGRDWKSITMKQPWVAETIGLVETHMAPIYARNAAAQARFLAEADGSAAVEVSASIVATNDALVLPASTVELLIDGERKFPRLLEDMAAAQRFIHLQYFIWECDELTAKITDVLLDRLKAGVKVRITYDMLGSFGHSKRELKQLRAAGAEVSSDVRAIAKVNYRNHRKIAVIDNEIGYAGGMNMGQEYIDGGSHYPAWRDTALRMTGQAVAELEKLFAMRWYELYREDLFGAEYMPAPDPAASSGGVLAQVVAHGVEDPWESARRTHAVAIASARERVRIQSPYFVPDAGTYDAMIGAALAGVDVEFMMTGWPDKKIAFDAAQSFFRPVVEAGGRIYLYDRGFFHAKTMTVDGRMLSIGTMNMDIRSLKLHKEFMVWLYDRGLVAEHDRVFDADLQHCHQVTLDAIDSWPASKRFRNSASRLASNVL